MGSSKLRSFWPQNPLFEKRPIKIPCSGQLPKQLTLWDRHKVNHSLTGSFRKAHWSHLLLRMFSWNRQASVSGLISRSQRVEMSTSKDHVLF